MVIMSEWDCWIGLEVFEAMSFPVLSTTAQQEMKLVSIKMLQRGFHFLIVIDVVMTDAIVRQVFCTVYW